MRGKYFTGLLAGLFFACGLGMTVFGSEADPELYGTPSMAPAYDSVEEFQIGRASCRERVCPYV